MRKVDIAVLTGALVVSVGAGAVSCLPEQDAKSWSEKKPPLSEPEKTETPPELDKSPDPVPESEAEIPPSKAPDLSHRRGDQKASLARMVNRLRVSAEQGGGYDRTAFGSRAPTAETRKALIAGEMRDDGTWRSLWDGKLYTEPSGLDADHTVALAEAWSSGASRWSQAHREQYANDLSSAYTLNLITSGLNRGLKSDKDPAEWLPATNTCEYVREWTAVKLRWGLTADAVEKNTLSARAARCGN